MGGSFESRAPLDSATRRNLKFNPQYAYCAKKACLGDAHSSAASIYGQPTSRSLQRASAFRPAARSDGSQRSTLVSVTTRPQFAFTSKARGVSGNVMYGAPKWLHPATTTRPGVKQWVIAGTLKVPSPLVVSSSSSQATRNLAADEHYFLLELLTEKRVGGGYEKCNDTFYAHP